MNNQADVIVVGAAPPAVLPPSVFCLPSNYWTEDKGRKTKLMPSSVFCLPSKPYEYFRADFCTKAQEISKNRKYHAAELPERSLP